MGVGKAQLPGGVDPGEKVDFDLVVGIFRKSVKPVVGLDLGLPKRRESDE